MKKIILIGGGGHSKACIDVIEQENKYEIAGILDLKEKVGQTVLNYPIIACDEDIEKFADSYDFLITLGQIESPEKRISLYNKLKALNSDIATIISPLAYVSRHASIGEGTIIMHGAIVNADAKVGNNSIINTRALIEHDAIIEDHCHISTGAVINGGARVGEGSFLGSTAITKHSITVEKYSFIKANRTVK